MTQFKLPPRAALDNPYGTSVASTGMAKELMSPE